MREVAWFVPPRTGEIEDCGSWLRGTAENVFVEWDRNLIWLVLAGTPRPGAKGTEERQNRT
ncbi:MAG: hypothetical protein A3I61_10285 [Acidobacteria bacterium RIFCSPLOWO2_02_FULL_68_18]|nr:MAG: hypothetical protein A3I61_10285 [Acidobacteria bacterium RIFCSPLOWO2_02_FULL_68_18]OFW48638.1 MAG: hypothetical protein A3G77_14115 [Acidobacteria bacterium RIFCSPLOWO2_12_FULL_68_19]